MPLRQAAFFFITIVLPCGVIAVMAARMLVQDRELVTTRVADARRTIVINARQQLLQRVERLRAGGDPTMRLPPEVVIAAPLSGSVMILPWEDSVRRADTLVAAGSAFHKAIGRAEREEFARNDFAAAAAIYLESARTAPAPEQRAWAQVLAARALTKAGRRTDAQAAARLALEASPHLLDDQGVPYVVYAARMLAVSPAIGDDDAARIVAALRRALDSPALGPAAIYMMKDAAAVIDAHPDLAGAVVARIKDLEQILSLRAALPTLGIAEWNGEAEPVWVRFGSPDNMWLVNIQARGGSRRVIAIRAAPIIASTQAALPVSISASADGDSLAPAFPGLRAVVSPASLAAVAADSSRQRPFYLAALLMVVSVAVFGGVLFWRDVRRDIRVAELRSQFVSSVSHELKTPLTAIRMFAETLLMGRARPEVQHEYLETIVNESERLTRLLNNVLDFSSIESGKKTYRLERQSLAPTVRAAAKAMEYPFAQQGFELRIAIDDDLPAVAADSDAIQQAILNLLSNAVKYSGQGRVVDLTLTRQGDAVEIAVTDRGVGIPAGEQSRIFEKYYRIRDRATERVTGTGLGLTLVEHVARGHGGRITVRSVPGQGSTFTLAIPIAPPGGNAIAASEVTA